MAAEVTTVVHDSGDDDSNGNTEAAEVSADYANAAAETARHESVEAENAAEEAEESAEESGTAAAISAEAAVVSVEAAEEAKEAEFNIQTAISSLETTLLTAIDAAQNPVIEDVQPAPVTPEPDVAPEQKLSWHHKLLGGSGGVFKK